MDSDEAGEFDIYKIDQLCALQWCAWAWKETPAEAIANCYRSTNLLGPILEHEPIGMPELEVLAKMIDAI